MEILEPPEGSGPVTGFVWLLLLPIFIIIGIFILPIYYTYKNREKIAEKVEEFEDEQTNREIQSGIQWRAILRINAIFYGGSFSIIGVLLLLTSILYNVENSEGKTGATLSMEQ